MNEPALILATALLSGLLATTITLWWQHMTEKKNKKKRIFETLMAYRYMISAEESVHALNSIDVIFYKDNRVRSAYEKFLEETEKRVEDNPQIQDKHLKLLEEMARVLGYKNIHWDNIKKTYYPSGLAQKIEDENTLRSLQIQNALDIAMENNQQE